MSNQLKNYDYNFPPELVAQEPLKNREDSRMMVLSPGKKKIHHGRFLDLPEFLQAGDWVVVNDTSVLAGRLFALKPTGGRVEVFLVRPVQGLEWSVFFSPGRGLQEGMELSLFSRESGEILPFKIEVSSLNPKDFRVRFNSEKDQDTILSHFGEMPLPPYIKRPKPNPEDRKRYQTIFAKNPGAVAAPTAGLHFTPSMKSALTQREIGWATVTLHVGPGTFLPVQTESIDEHPMHAEWYQISSPTQQALQECRQRGGRVLAVGSTTLRALESLALTGKTQGWTDLFIRPGFQLKMADFLLTNFHQPRSTLFILVAALAGRKFLLKAYREAVAEKYRLFSYGDCMLIRP